MLPLDIISFTFFTFPSRDKTHHYIVYTFTLCLPTPCFLISLSLCLYLNTFFHFYHFCILSLPLSIPLNIFIIWVTFVLTCQWALIFLDPKSKLSQSLHLNNWFCINFSLFSFLIYHVTIFCLDKQIWIKLIITIYLKVPLSSCIALWYFLFFFVFWWNISLNLWNISTVLGQPPMI